jgi:TrfA protein
VGLQTSSLPPRQSQNAASSPDPLQQFGRKTKGSSRAAHGAYKIEFTGVQLTQAHLDVFEGVMHIARGLHEGNRIRFSAHKLLKLIGRHTGKAEHEWLYLVLQDLTATSVSIKKEANMVFWGSLLPRGAGELKRGEYVIEMSRELITLFERGFTQIQWEQRRSLKKKPLACWLQLYYSSHAKPYAVTVQFLREQSGSGTSSIRSFRQNLKNALDEIKTVGVIASWQIENDRVTVERVPSASQQRHLEQR